jgi:tRNA(Ile)-lysidine synthase
MKVLLAVSGGIDSMCMADMFGRAGDDFAVAHCNFHLRGADSDADAEFVERWGREHGVPFFRADFDTAAYASEHGVSIEMAARELRYAWFAQVAVENGFDAVAVAHNANDNAETLILNLLRGTGLRGLRGISPISPLPVGPIQLLRPMLGMTREQIEAYAAKHGVEYREDRTNSEVEYKRNRIRNNVFPEFAKVNPSFVRTLNEDMERFAEAEDIVEDYFREAEDKVLNDNKIDIDALLGLRHWKYVLFRILEPLGYHQDTLKAVQRLLEGYASGGEGTFAGKRFLSPTHVLETSSGYMILRTRDDGAPEDDVLVEGPGDYSLRGRTVRIELLSVPAGITLKQPAGTLICDAATLPFPFILRGWHAGDWMRPFGMDGKAKKLSDLFSDGKFSLSDKEAAVVVYSPSLDKAGDGHVAAVAGLRMDEALRVAKGSVSILRITLP